jgi:AraC-like DNA-binding protein
LCRHYPRHADAACPRPDEEILVPTALPLYHSRPPYSRFVPAEYSTPRTIGDVWGILITEDTDPRTLRLAVTTLVGATPSVAVVAVFRRTASDPLRIAPVAAAAGLAAVALETPALDAALRRNLTSLERLPSEFRQWLRHSGIARDDRVVAVLARGLRKAARRAQREGGVTVGGLRAGVPSVADMAEFAGLTPRGLRDSFARHRLPPPGQWKIFFRELVQANLVQRDPDTPLIRVAVTLGYADSQALSHAFQQCFGVTPTFVRERLGWQWLASCWREKQKRVWNRQSSAGFDHARRRFRPHHVSAAVGRP